MTIVYLHGFRSSPHSTKARLLGQAMAARGRASEYFAPALPISPAHAVRDVLTLVETHTHDPSELALIGSSLGGYYALWLAERLGCRAVLLNPAVFAARDLEGAIGTHTQWHDPRAQVELTRTHVDELRALEVAHITLPERYYLVAATGDEVLDWREMVAKLRGAHHRIVEGSDHGLSDFPRHLDSVLDFCGVTA